MPNRSSRIIAPVGAIALVTACGGGAPAASAPEATEPEVVMISGVAPAEGFATGGTRVIINGTGLRRVATVNFGAAAGLHLRVRNDGSISVVAPPHAVGQVSIRVVDVTGASGVGTLAFRFIQPDSTDCPGCWDY